MDLHFAHPSFSTIFWAQTLRLAAMVVVIALSHLPLSLSLVCFLSVIFGLLSVAQYGPTRPIFFEATKATLASLLCCAPLLLVL